MNARAAFFLGIAVLAGQAAPVRAQPMDMPMDHGAMEHRTMNRDASMPPMRMQGALGAYPPTRDASGTSWQPDSAPHAGIPLMAGDWMLMLQGRLQTVLDSQSGPRGDTMTYLSGMGMAMASRDFGDAGVLGLRGMFSLDPFMGRRGYPLLLASGETANGTTHLVDRQHPHDLFKELAATYSRPIGAQDSLFVYAGYPGEPALGPAAYMHRVSGQDIPETPISHHWLDSTHVTFGVVTAGWVHDAWKIEVSQFTGREPDQHRFDFDAARFDSTAARLSWNPDPHWSLQVSGGFLKSPEQLDPAENETRLTASATWYTPLGQDGSFAATLAGGYKRFSNGAKQDAVLFEAEYRPSDAWTLFARAETIASGELVPETGLKRAAKLSLGAIHDWRLADHLKFGLGGLYAFDVAPASAAAPYGGGPHGTMGFLRIVAE